MFHHEMTGYKQLSPQKLELSDAQRSNNSSAVRKKSIAPAIPEMERREVPVGADCVWKKERSEAKLAGFGSNSG